jgi:hypothetical protein
LVRIVLDMSDFDLLRKLYTTHLLARVRLCEIWRVSLNTEIDSPQITPERKAEAISERDQVIVEWGKIMTELEDLKKESSSSLRLSR